MDKERKILEEHLERASDLIKDLTNKVFFLFLFLLKNMILFQSLKQKKKKKKNLEAK